ncbi:TPA: hypothetical protein ACH3X1_011124 [Trebouxia sp. C0004]
MICASSAFPNVSKDLACLSARTARGETDRCNQPSIAYMGCTSSFAALPKAWQVQPAQLQAWRTWIVGTHCETDSPHRQLDQRCDFDFDIKHNHVFAPPCSTSLEAAEAHVQRQLLTTAPVS